MDDEISKVILCSLGYTNLHFFHQMDDFIFLEFGADKKAFFYFYKKSFDTIEDAESEAKNIVAQHY